MTILLSDPANGYHTGTYTAAVGNIATLASSGAILAQRPLAVGQVGIVRQFFDRGSGGATSQFAVNGGITNFTLGAGDYSAASLNTLDIGAFTPDTTHSQNAQVAEVLIYNAGLSNAERNILENYLSAKYSGTTGVHQVPIVNDLYIGDESAQGHYDFGVFGIGRHTDASVITTGTSDGLTISQNSVLGSDEWVLAGHAGGPNGTTTNDMPGGERWERSWFVDATNVTIANLAFDWDDAGVSATFDPNFNGLYYRQLNSGFFTQVAVGNVDIGNQRVDFTGVNLPLADGYFTLGTIPVPEPSTFALLGVGAIGLAIKSGRRRRTTA